MRIKNANLEWYALRWDINKDKLEWFNVLTNTLKETIAIKMHTHELITLENLKELLITEFRYYYWSKVEYEVAISDVIDNDFENAIKIDVYSQLQPNISRIAEYINNEMQLELE